MNSVLVAICVCLVATGVLLYLLRRERLSLGMPLAYLLLLLLNHLPSAWTSLATQGIYGGYVVEYGFTLTTVGVVCSVVGVVLAGSAVDGLNRRKDRTVATVARRPALQAPRHIRSRFRAPSRHRRTAAGDGNAQ